MATTYCVRRGKWVCWRKYYNIPTICSEIFSFIYFFPLFSIEAKNSNYLKVGKYLCVHSVLRIFLHKYDRKFMKCNQQLNEICVGIKVPAVSVGGKPISLSCLLPTSYKLSFETRRDNPKIYKWDTKHF